MWMAISVNSINCLRNKKHQCYVASQRPEEDRTLFKSFHEAASLHFKNPTKISQAKKIIDQYTS